MAHMARQEELHYGDFAATVYKQIPGADIEPGWWVVLRSPGRDYWVSVHHYKRDAMKAACILLHRQPEAK